MNINDILAEIIRKLYDIENCTGDWNPECEDILSNGCVNCCRGRKLLEKIKINDINNHIKENQNETKKKLTHKG